MVSIGEQSAASLITSTAYILSKQGCFKAYEHEHEKLMREKLSKEFCILFLEDDSRRYYYVPSYDFGIKAKKGETLDLYDQSLRICSYFQTFDQEYDEESKSFYYSSDTVVEALEHLNWRMQSIINKAKEKGLKLDNWKIVECMLLENLKRHRIESR